MTSTEGHGGPTAGVARGGTAPVTGSAVTLVPALNARLITGSLLRWDAPDGAGIGAEVRMTVDIAPTIARSGEFPVWATVNAPGGDTLVLSARARTAGEDAHELLLEGRVAVREPRRRTVRAAAHVDVDLSLPGAEGRIPGRTLDLSSGGCRVALEPGDVPLPAVGQGEPADIVIHLDADNRPRMRGHVHAVRSGGQVVIRFDEVPQAVVEQIQRYVYATLP